MLTKLVQGVSVYAVLATFVVMMVCYLLTFKKRKAVPKMIDIHLLNKRILEFQPEQIINLDIVESIKNKKLETHVPDESDPECLNLAKINYLNFLNNETLKKKAEECIREYGVGSCGPRGFYGTVDIHLNIEERIAKFMDLEDTVLYSYGFSTISSAIGAYCKKSDIIFCDEQISFAAQQGMLAAKSTVVYFKHNDVEDLRHKLEEYDNKEQQRKKMFRKFLIVEGIYEKTGTICPLPELLDLCEKHKLRIFLDESLSFGVLGKTGRGVTEHFNIDRSRVDMIMSSLENSLGSIGGFCVGASVVIEHQRLSGLGYCFSASLPPFLCYVATCAIDLMENDPGMFEKLKNISVEMGEKLKTIPEIEVISDPISPKKVIRPRNLSIQVVQDKCAKEKLYLLTGENELFLNVNIELTEVEMDKVVKILKNTCCPE